MENINENNGGQIARLNKLGTECLPGMFGIEFISVQTDSLESRLKIRPQFLAPNGFLHAATVIALADTTCGYATMLSLPDGAENFTTIELKSNLISTAREGTIACQATPVHRGRSTQVWDAEVYVDIEAASADAASKRKIAVFRCTQMVLWPT